MRSKEKWLRNCKLYLILDAQVCSYDALFDIAKQAITYGVDMIQLRDKNGTANNILKFSKSVLALTKHKIPYIINDRLDLALIARADGVHLGQDDISIDVARRMMGKRAIIGVSCQTLAHAKEAQQKGADYLGFGSVFKTLTKPQRNPMDLNLLTKVSRAIKIPVFAIGGINLTNVSMLVQQGVNRVAVCRSICESRDIRKSIEAFKSALSLRAKRSNLLS